MTKKSLFISLSIAVVLLVAMLLCSFMINNNMAYADYQDILNDGNSIVNFNQVFKNSTSNTLSVNGISRTTTDYTYSISGTATANDYIWADVVGLNSTHKYYFNCYNDTITLRIHNFNNSISSPFIYTGQSYLTYAINFISGQTYNITIKPILIDLSSMFGIGSEPNLQECQDLFVADYYPYNIGSPISLSGFTEYSKGVSDTYSNLQLNITNYSAFSSAYIVSELSSNFPETFIERYIDYEVLRVPFMKARGVLGVPLNDIAPAGTLIKFSFIDPAQGGSGNYLWCGIQYGNQFVPVMYIGSDDVPTDENGYISFACPFDTQTLCFCESSSSTQFIMETSAFWLGELQVINAKMGDIQTIIDSAISGAIYERDEYWSYYYRYGDGYQSIYNSGYTAGINADAEDFGSRYYTFTQFLGALFDVPVRVIVSLLDFDFLGFNLKNFAFSMITLAIVFAIIRLILQKTGDKE